MLRRFSVRPGRQTERPSKWRAPRFQHLRQGCSRMLRRAPGALPTTRRAVAPAPCGVRKFDPGRFACGTDFTRPTRSARRARRSGVDKSPRRCSCGITDSFTVRLRIVRRSAFRRLLPVCCPPSVTRHQAQREWRNCVSGTHRRLRNPHRRGIDLSRKTAENRSR